VLRKLGLNSNAELAYYALKNRLIDRGVVERLEVDDKEVDESS
jgi:hypothetical protein